MTSSADKARQFIGILAADTKPLTVKQITKNIKKIDKKQIRKESNPSDIQYLKEDIAALKKDIARFAKSTSESGRKRYHDDLKLLERWEARLVVLKKLLKN